MIILNNPLKELDQIYASEEIKKQTLNYVINCKHYSNLLLLVPLCVCVLLFGIFIFPKDNVSCGEGSLSNIVRAL